MAKGVSRNIGSQPPDARAQNSRDIGRRRLQSLDQTVYFGNRSRKIRIGVSNDVRILIGTEAHSPTNRLRFPNVRRQVEETTMRRIYLAPGSQQFRSAVA